MNTRPRPATPAGPFHVAHTLTATDAVTLTLNVAEQPRPSGEANLAIAHRFPRPGKLSTSEHERIPAWSTIGLITRPFEGYNNVCEHDLEARWPGLAGQRLARLGMGNNTATDAVGGRGWQGGVGGHRAETLGRRPHWAGGVAYR